MQISTGSVKQTPATYRQRNESSLFGRLLSSVSGDRHRRAFLDWLNLNLEHQLADLEEFLYSLPEDQPSRMEPGLIAVSYLDMVPQDAPQPERLLFQKDLE